MNKLFSKSKFNLGMIGQKKDVIAWLIKYGVVTIIFLVMYLPIRNQVSVLSTNKTSLTQDVENLKKITDSLMTAEESVALQERLTGFEKKIVSTQDAIVLIEQINKMAEKHHLSVIQIYSDSAVSIKDASNVDLDYEGTKLSLLPINFRLEADFKNLGNFLYEIRDQFIATFVVESIQIQKSATQAEGLQCDIILGFVAK